MTPRDLTNKKNKVVKVVFKPHDSRFPMIGKFVDLKDSEELENKGMVRFVNQKYLEFWNDSEPQFSMTKIYVVADFTQVITM